MLTFSEIEKGVGSTVFSETEKRWCVDIIKNRVAVSGFLPGGGEFFLEVSSGGGEKIAL